MIREAFGKSDNGDSKISPGKSGRINEIRTPRGGVRRGKVIGNRRIRNGDFQEISLTPLCTCFRSEVEQKR